jgi:hypothetical protein
MMIGESAVASFGPSNYWTKINKTKFVMTLGGRQSTIAHNNQPHLRQRNEGGYDRTCGCRGTLGKGKSIVLGAVKLGRGRELNKIDALIKLIFFLASLSI